MYMKNKNGVFYRYVYNGMEKAYFCVTHYSEKTDKDFQQKTSFYKKEVDMSDDCVKDIYDVKCYVYWNSKIEGISDRWEIPILRPWMDDKVVRLQHEGLLSGWETDEKYLCSKYVELSAIEGYEIEFEYIVKDGVKLEKKEIIKKKVERQEFEEIFEKHLSENI